MTAANRHSGFKKLSFATLIAVYFLIMLGGVVRSTGSGMGCPDWPKCFGQWVPPTDESELPDSYKEDYAAYRHQKNVRIAKYLQFFGMSDKADQITKDESILVSEDFNVFKTWTEYANRLAGAIIGLMIFAMALGAVSYWREDRPIFYLSFFTLFLVGFQGWIGSIVVSTNLTPWMITIHMIIALVIVLLLIYINFRIRKPKMDQSSLHEHKMMLYLTIFCLGALALQIVMGTQVRESIDMIASGLAYGFRDTWISKVGLEFYVHRSFSIAILALHIWLLIVLMRSKDQFFKVKKLGKWVVILIFMEILSGVVMAYFSIPPFMQPIHLLLSTVIFGLLFYMSLLIKNTDLNFAIS